MIKQGKRGRRIAYYENFTWLNIISSYSPSNANYYLCLFKDRGKTMKRIEKITVDDAELITSNGARVVGFKDRENFMKFFLQVGEIVDAVNVLIDNKDKR